MEPSFRITSSTAAGPPSRDRAGARKCRATRKRRAASAVTLTGDPSPVVQSGELLEPVSDPRAKLVRLHERCVVCLGAGEHVLRRRPGLQAAVEVDQGGGARPRPTGHQGRPGEAVERLDLLAGEVEVELNRRVGDDVRCHGHDALDVRVRHPAFHGRKLLAAEEEPRRGAPLPREGLGIRNHSPVVRQVGRRLEVGHEAILLRSGRIFLRPMPTSPLELTRAQILAFRRRVSALDERLPRGARSLRGAAWAGLTDSVPRAALLSIHARVEETRSSSWEDPSLVQVWGPRYSVYVVPARDRAVFTLGRLPNDARRCARAEDMAARVHAHLAGRRLKDNDVQRALGIGNAIKYAAPTGTLLLRWDGARAPDVWAVPPPEIEPHEARRELARRYLHVFGPEPPAAFAAWAGVGEAESRATFDALSASLTAVRTPIGDAWILARDEPGFREPLRPPAAARLLPSGDTYFLFWGA